MASNVHKLFPYSTTIDTLDLKGKHVTMALETSVSEYDTVLHGRFLHFSGKPIENKSDFDCF